MLHQKSEWKATYDVTKRLDCWCLIFVDMEFTWNDDTKEKIRM